ncbi:hypothetical protein, partial [Staphylococcus aureus]
NSHVGTAEQVVVKRTLSVSFIAGLPADRRAQVERQVRALIARTPELTGDGAVAFPYETSMYAYRKARREGAALPCLTASGSSALPA